MSGHVLQMHSLSMEKNVVTYDCLFCSLEWRVDYLRKKYGIEITLIDADIGGSVKFE